MALAFLLALLLGVLVAIWLEEEKAALSFGLVFVVGLLAFCILLLRSRGDRVFFRFSLIFGIEWLLLPLAAYISAVQTDTLGEALGGLIIMAILGPAGIILGLLFLLLALLKARARHRP